MFYIPHQRLQIATLMEGQGEPILLIHGFGSTHAVNWVNTGWVEDLRGAGRRVIVFDNRGHGASSKVYDPAQYDPAIMAQDALAVLDALNIEKADIMGYSMGARIASFLAAENPARVSKLIIGGLGTNLFADQIVPDSVEAALRAPSLEHVTDPVGRMFRQFADNNGQDLMALAACIVGSRRGLPEEYLLRIPHDTLVAVGTRDSIARDGDVLAARFVNGRFAPIPNREHNPAVGDKAYKTAVLEFLKEA